MPIEAYVIIGLILSVFFVLFGTISREEGCYKTSMVLFNSVGFFILHLTAFFVVDDELVTHSTTYYDIQHLESPQGFVMQVVLDDQGVMHHLPKPYKEPEMHLMKVTYQSYVPYLGLHGPQNFYTTEIFKKTEGGEYALHQAE